LQSYFPNDGARQGQSMSVLLLHAPALEVRVRHIAISSRRTILRERAQKYAVRFAIVDRPCCSSGLHSLVVGSSVNRFFRERRLLGNSKGSFHYIGCHRKPISLHDYVLKPACIFTIDTIVQYLTQKG
jgi:hypothetical protein